MVLPCQVPQRGMAIFDAQPFGPGLFLRDAALFVAHLDDQISLLMPCLAQKQAPARPRTKWQQTLVCQFVVSMSGNGDEKPSLTERPPRVARTRSSSPGQVRCRSPRAHACVRSALC
ncbi:hypothetical protein EA795_00535 [Stutzerimonas nitrititolerans]|uniref:Uncharacterized protein n=1 Tax=Stutzerimonas nitrititolerans TaxID=2482751 RepID=A0ABX9V9T0_9GAMM|nr:hypothetical protein EA795_00535 [Stutzerimonas nitrititolerans]